MSHKKVEYIWDVYVKSVICCDIVNHSMRYMPHIDTINKDCYIILNQILWNLTVLPSEPLRQSQYNVFISIEWQKVYSIIYEIKGLFNEQLLHGLSKIYNIRGNNKNQKYHIPKKTIGFVYPWKLIFRPRNAVNNTTILPTTIYKPQFKRGKTTKKNVNNWMAL